MRIAALSLVGVVACDTPPAVFGEVLPDDRVLLTEEELVPMGTSKAPSTWATWLLDEAMASNLRHRELVHLIEAVTELPSTYRDRGETEAVAWGPWIVQGAAERMWVERAGADEYAWAVERQSVDPDRVRIKDDAWITDLSGQIHAPASVVVGGSFVIDVDEVGIGALELAGIDEGPMGRAALRYTVDPAGATFTTFDEVRGTVVPEHGGVTFTHEPGVGGTATATVTVDGSDPVDVHVQWVAGGGGRADVTSSSGSTASECWGADHGLVWTSEGLGDPTGCVVTAP